MRANRPGFPGDYTCRVFPGRERENPSTGHSPEIRERAGAPWCSGTRRSTNRGGRRSGRAWPKSAAWLHGRSGIPYPLPCRAVEGEHVHEQADYRSPERALHSSCTAGTDGDGRRDRGWPCQPPHPRAPGWRHDRYPREPREAPPRKGVTWECCTASYAIPGPNSRSPKPPGKSGGCTGEKGRDLAHPTSSVNASGSPNARYANRDATGADHVRYEPPWMAGATPVLFGMARAVRGPDTCDAHGGA